MCVCRNKSITAFLLYSDGCNFSISETVHVNTLLVWVERRDAKHSICCGCVVCGVWCACANARCVCVQAAGRRHRAVRGDVVVAHEAHVAGAGRRLGRRVLRRRQRHHQFRRVAPPTPRPPPLWRVSTSTLHRYVSDACVSKTVMSHLIKF